MAAYLDHGYYLWAAMKGPGFAVMFGLLTGGIAWLIETMVGPCAGSRGGLL